MADVGATGVRAIDDAVASASSVRDLARRLGRHVLEQRKLVLQDLDRITHARRLMEPVRIGAADPQLSSWPVGGRTLDPDLVVAIRKLVSPELAILALLQGLCSGGGPIELAFSEEWGRVELQLGDPFPIPPRKRMAGGRPLPNPRDTVRALGALMEISNFEIHQGALWPTTLSFRHKERLDGALSGPSDESGELVPPPIAVIWPLDLSDFDLPAKERTEQHWFGLWPLADRWSLANVIGALERAAAAGCTIAILPELAVPDPDALGEAIRNGARMGRLPPLIVAGSAHIRTVRPLGPPLRSNESVTYLNGSEVLRHRKIHPYQTDDTRIVGAGPGGRRSEWLGTEGSALHVAMGESGRLAVLICADVLDADLHRQLIEVEANVVLVPAWTIDGRGFDALEGVVNLNQAIVVVANAASEPFSVRCLFPDDVQNETRWSPEGDQPFAVAFDPRDLPGTIQPL